MNPANSQEALASLQQAQATAQDPNSILSGQRQQLGVDKAQETVTGLRGAINNTTKLLKQVAPSVMGRTGSSLVTNAQATRQVVNEQAPIQQTLTDQGGQLNEATTDLNTLNQRAQEAASGIYSGQQDKLSYAQNLYNTLYQKERDAQAAAEAEKQRQEQMRQFNESMALDKQKLAASTAAANKSYDLGGGATAPKATSSQRQNGGFNFQDANGNAISAAKYAQLTGTNLLDVLAKMGQSGDKYAANIYNQLKANSGMPISDNVKRNYSSIFWGT